MWARSARGRVLLRGGGAEVTSLFLQIYDGVSAPNPDEPVELLAGSDHIVEELRIGRLFPGNEGEKNSNRGCGWRRRRGRGRGRGRGGSEERGESGRRARRCWRCGRCGRCGTASTTVTTAPPLRFKISPGRSSRRTRSRARCCTGRCWSSRSSRAATRSSTCAAAPAPSASAPRPPPSRRPRGTGRRLGGQQERRLCGKVVGVGLRCGRGVREGELGGERGRRRGRTEWVCSRAELVMEKLLDGTSTASKYASSSSSSSSSSERRRRRKGDGPGGGAPSAVVAVVDPPRSGLHRSVLVALRNCATIRRLVYVSCNPTGSLLPDLVALCGPSSKQLTGACFRPVKAVPVDLFPATAHTEMVLARERYDAAAEAARGRRRRRGGS